MNENVVPIRKSERFPVLNGDVVFTNEVLESQQIGFAYMKPNSRLLRMKLWMFPNEQYFIAPYENDPTKYTVLSLEEYQPPGQESRTVWNKIGSGDLKDNYIHLTLNFPKQDVFVSLFPDKEEPKAQNAAS